MTRTSAQPVTVAVTGSAGAVGAEVCRELVRRGHDVRGLDRRDAAGPWEQIVGDITDADAVEAALIGAQAVVHLAAFPDEAPFMERLLGPNVGGMVRVAETARRLGARRLILASSAQVVHPHMYGDPPAPADAAPKPQNHYALAKAWAEQLGEMYARVYGMSVLAVRIGWLPRNAVDARKIRRNGQDEYLSHRDAGRFFACAVEADRPAPGDFATLNAASRPTGPTPLLDIDAARAMSGYEPADAFPDGMPQALRNALDRPGNARA